LKKREWVYVHKPVAYEMHCDKCDGINITWSEYEGMIWCYDCQIDTKGTGGMLDGPVPIHLLSIFGLSLDRICLKTKRILRMKLKDNTLVWEPDPSDPVPKEEGRF